MPYTTIQTIEELEALHPPAARAPDIGFDRILPALRAFIERSRFMVVTTSGRGGIDVSPRGGEAGFIVVEDEHTLLMPDRAGNNRIDSMRNLLEDPRVGLLLLVPRVSAALRAHGTVSIDRSLPLRQRFEEGGKLPTCVWVIRVQSIFFQSGGAAERGSLWTPGGWDVARNEAISSKTVAMVRKVAGRT